MTKFKRLMAVVAVSMLGIQLMGAGTAFAAQPDGDCDFGSDNLEVTLGTDSGNGDVDLYIDDEGVLYCDAQGGGADDDQPVATIESITVEMDDEDALGQLTIILDDNGSGTGNNQNASEWPDFDTFDINVTTQVNLEGDGIDDASANRLRITVGAKSLSFLGTTATSNSPKYDIDSGEGSDLIDASKATARVYVDGGDGNDTIKGGSGKDTLNGDAGVDVLYGNGGNDTLDCGGDGEITKFEQGWGGEGDDSITDCNIVAPGAGNDDVYNSDGATPWDPDPNGDDDTTDADVDDELFALSYADLTGGMEWDSSELLTGGDAGEDVIEIAPVRFYGTQGDDVIYDENASRVYGNAGDDLIKVGDGAVVFAGGGNDVVGDASGADVSDTFYGQGGNDVLRGKMGSDDLFGGAGNDQTWGGPGADTCGGEVTNRCEYFKGRN